MSTLRNNKKKEKARVPVRSAVAGASFRVFLSRVRKAGRQKLTIMLVPHTEKRILNLQLSYFALWGDSLRGRPRLLCLPLFCRAIFGHREQASIPLKRSRLDADQA